jgi:hypothetical protein
VVKCLHYIPQNELTLVQEGAKPLGLYEDSHKPLYIRNAPAFKLAELLKTKQGSRPIQEEDTLDIAASVHKSDSCFKLFFLAQRKGNGLKYIDV